MKNKLLYTSLYALMIGGTLALSVSSPVMAKSFSGSSDVYVDDSLEENENFKNKVMWSNAVDDPGLGGTQLEGSQYINVTHAYGDTLGNTGINVQKAGRIAADTFITWMGGQTKIEKMKSQATELAEGNVRTAENQLENARRQSLIHGGEVAQYQREVNSAKRAFDNCMVFCDSERQAWNAAISRLDSAQNNYEYWQGQISKWQSELNKDKENLEKWKKTDQELHEQALNERDKVIKNYLENLSLDERKEIISIANVGTTDNWDERMSNPSERKALQNRFDKLGLVYNGSPIDLSTETGRDYAKRFIDTLNSTVPSTTN